jgi:amino acid transporter
LENNEQTGAPQLKRVLGFRDVVLFFITACINLQWVATTAGAGPKAIVLWLIAFATMMLPLAFCVIELASRYPQEGGIYIWSKHAFGEFGGFLTGWSYWIANLPYFPGVLFFGISNALYIGGDRWQHLSDSNSFMVSASILLLALATYMNLVGLNVGKWLNNAGAVARWLAALGLMTIGIIAWFKFGSATEFSGSAMIPAARLKDLIFWSTIAFAITGLEAASFMGEEIKDSRRTIPRAILVAAPIIILVYIISTVSVQVAVPASEASRLQGVMEAMDSATDRLGLGGLSPIAAFLVALSAIGSVGLWLGASARLPFVAGIDRFLPRWFARVHPKWRTPHYSLLFLAGIEVVCIFFAQAGTTVAGAYEFLVSMSIISFLIPFLFMFASLIRLQREPAGPDVRRVPGGKAGAIFVGCLGFFTVSAAIVLSFVPPESETDPLGFIMKLVISTLVMILSGVILYALGRRRARSARA